MAHEEDLADEVEAAWVGFRQRLADRISDMSPGEVLLAEYTDLLAPLDDEAGDGSGAPYVQLCLLEDERVLVQASGTRHLRPEAVLTDDQVQQMVELAWLEVVDDDDEEHFEVTFARREADAAAVLVVRTLREVHGVPHPAFLAAGGLETDPATEPVWPTSAGHGGGAGGDAVGDVVWTRSPDELQEAVDAAMRVVFPELKHDPDGDIPVAAGRSLAFIRVQGRRPAVAIFAEIVIEPRDTERLAVELDLLNSEHPLWKFHGRDEVVVMSYELPALPLVPDQLRWTVREFLSDVDEVARVLAQRVGGRRYFDVDPAQAPQPPTADAAARVDDAHPGMVGLLELLHLGRMRPQTVAGLFDNDRLEIIRQLVRVRTGAQPCDGHDTEVVLTALRKGLRLVSDGVNPDATTLRPTRPDSVQPSLIDDDDLGGDEPLDLWRSA